MPCTRSGRSSPDCANTCPPDRFWFPCSRARTRLRSIARSWAPPIRRKPRPARSAVHKERPFFAGLCEYMSSGPILVSVLEGENAIAKHREIMGATDPAKAAPGTIRREWGKDVEKNAVHGSDGSDTAAAEIQFFFKPDEIHSS